MRKIAKFEKVSEEQFVKDFADTFKGYPLEAIKGVYQCLKLPQRATKLSGGYDFYSPLSFTLKPQETIKIPTGIRVKIDDSFVLQIFPRSGLGFKYRLQLDNTVGIIDADYYGSSNEGHIFIKITNDSLSDKVMTINVGEGFAQGIFLEYGITVDDDVETVRDGGFGSTTK